jgi:hypothetical protein
MDAARAQARFLPEMSEQYRDIDAQANELRMANIARRVLGEGAAGPFIKSDAWGAIATHLRAVENEGFNISNLLKDSINEGDFDASEDAGAVLAWRVEDRLDRWRSRAVDPGRRPLESMSDEALERLELRAVGELMRAKAEAARMPAIEQADRKTLVRGWLAEKKDTPWQRRLHCLPCQGRRLQHCHRPDRNRYRRPRPEKAGKNASPPSPGPLRTRDVRILRV